jgi:hypothetical protein
MIKKHMKCSTSLVIKESKSKAHEDSTSLLIEWWSSRTQITYNVDRNIN